jgi:hypothetical protein
MKTKITETHFGSITAGGKSHSNDILIRLDGTVEKRKKKLSKEVFGTSHILSQAEAEYVYQEGAALLLIGSGQSGLVKLSPEAAAFFEKKHCRVELLPTPQAIQRWNELEEPCIGLFHITC